jgi:hypothetical protein
MFATSFDSVKRPFRMMGERIKAKLKKNKKRVIVCDLKE